MAGGLLARLFYALPLEAGAAARVAELVAPLRTDFPRARWAAPETYHLTLLFLGDVPAEASAEMQAALALAGSGAEPFDCRLSHSGGFGGGRRDRVAWLGLDDTAADRCAVLASALREGLARSRVPAVQEALERAGRGPFRAHLTLCRRATPPLEAELVRRLARDEPIGWRAASIELLSSRLLAGGPEHTVLQRAPLGRTGQALPSAEHRGVADGVDHGPGAEAAEGS